MRTTLRKPCLFGGAASGEVAGGTAVAKVAVMATTLSNSGMETREGGAGVRPRGRGTRSLLRNIGIALLMLALGYGAGRVHGMFEASGVASEHAAALAEQRRSAAQAESQQRAALTQAVDQAALARDQRDELAALSTFYEAYRQTQLALLGLDERNFGIAQTHLREAERLLVTRQSELSELEPLLQRIASTNVAVAGNLGEQRRSVAAIASELDGLIAPRAAAMVSAGTSAGGTAVDATSHADPAPAAQVAPAEERRLEQQAIPAAAP